MSRDDATVFRTFIVTMGKKCDYMLDYAGIKKCRKAKSSLGLLVRCEGKLNNRPEWCPMREITSEGSLKE
jgi:hypothetical protein